MHKNGIQDQQKTSISALSVNQLQKSAVGVVV